MVDSPIPETEPLTDGQIEAMIELTDPRMTRQMTEYEINANAKDLGKAAAQMRATIASLKAALEEAEQRAVYWIERASDWSGRYWIKVAQAAAAGAENQRLQAVKSAAENFALFWTESESWESDGTLETQLVEAVAALRTSTGDTESREEN